MSTENLYSLDGEGSTYDDLFTAMTERKRIKCSFQLRKRICSKER